MKAGKFKYQIKVFSKVTSTDEFGSQTDTYILTRTTKAAVDWKTGSRTANNEIFLTNTLEITVRKYVEINDNTHIELEGKMYKIVSHHEDYHYHDQIVVIELINK